MRVLTLLLAFLPSSAFACAMYVPPEVVAQRQEAAKKAADAAKAKEANADTTPAATAQTLEALMRDIDQATAVPVPTTIPEAQPAS